MIAHQLQPLGNMRPPSNPLAPATPNVHDVLALVAGDDTPDKLFIIVRPPNHAQEDRASIKGAHEYSGAPRDTETPVARKDEYGALSSDAVPAPGFPPLPMIKQVPRPHTTTHVPLTCYSLTSIVTPIN
jgi:hypothetical protein